MKRTLLFAVPVLLAGLLYWIATAPEPAGNTASLTVVEALSGEPQGFARAEQPRSFQFPQDHGPHPEYRSEWWYFTGNLRTGTGRHFGFQLTFFRFALAARATARASNWAAHQVYMGHFALTDVQGRRFHSFERFSREAAGLAGARRHPLKVWLEDWALEQTGGEKGGPRFVLRAEQDGIGIELELASEKPPVLQGDRGLSQKGAEPGNASYYYSLTRMAARGTVRLAGSSHAVEGLAWMDREWSTSALGEDQAGWDWFALQLDDGRELMYYQLRRRDGSVDPHSAGTLVAADGQVRSLTHEDVSVTVMGEWASPRDGARYPSGWRLRVPSVELDLELWPYLDSQEMDLSVRYWEGAVRFSGNAGQRVVRGDGYVELTGYAASAGGVGSEASR